MKLFLALLFCAALAEYKKRPQPHRQIMTDPDRIYFKPVRRQITDIESMNKDEFAIYNNRTVQQLRFKDPRELTLDEAEDICEFYGTLRKWQARMDDDEERELWLKEKAHQRQVQYQSAQHERVEKKKKKQDPKNWGNGEKPKKNNKEKMNKTEIENFEMDKMRQHERLRDHENFTDNDDLEEEIIMDEEENEIRKRRENDDNEENKEDSTEDDLPSPREYFGAQEDEEDLGPPLTQEQLYKDNLKVHEITGRLFQTKGDMEFDAVWEKVKNQIPWSFSKGKADWKLKDIFQRQANNMRDDEKDRMRAAAEAKRQRDEKEAMKRMEKIKNKTNL
ncbi:unnamed protein product [Oikopleura dioica]|uniref:Uncharacterized protein n=1 Tax=Oikopleura dioica TaxID=34765 RepID=E4XQX8_OIKDI|nr:unnamed protein product [Oikopleura dioica]